MDLARKYSGKFENSSVKFMEFHWTIYRIPVLILWNSVWKFVEFQWRKISKIEIPLIFHINSTDFQNSRKFSSGIPQIFLGFSWKMFNSFRAFLRSNSAEYSAKHTEKFFIGIFKELTWNYIGEFVELQCKFYGFSLENLLHSNINFMEFWLKICGIPIENY